MNALLRILIVEDVATDAELIEMELESANIQFQAERVATKQQYIDNLSEFTPDLIISDYSLPGFGALEALRIKQDINPSIPFILVTGAQTEEIAVDCIKKGADDYILKSSLTRLPTSIQNAINKKDAEKQKIHAIEELKTREEKYRNLFENSLIGMFRASSVDCRFLEVNEKVNEILGVENAEGMCFDEFGWCNGDIRLSNYFTQNCLSVKNFEVCLSKPDGETWISISAKYYPGEEIIEGIIYDITQTKNSLIELEKANYELDSFAYHASHDLRSPLRSLEGLLQAAMEEDSLNEIREIMKMMQKSTHKMDKLISDLLILAKNKKSEARIIPIDFEQEIKDCITQLSHMENFFRLKISYKVEQHSAFYSDAVRLRIILTNIVSNAVKYHRYDQPDPFVFIETIIRNERCYLKVEDNGSGIAEKHLDKIFNMFYRANKESEGSGLGLFLVKSTIEKMGGSIKAHSLLNSGTVFYIELPNATYSPSVIIEDPKLYIQNSAG